VRPANVTCRHALRRLVWFTMSIAAVSALVSLFLTIWIDVSWWKVFRRSVSVSAAIVLWLFIKYTPGLSFRSLGFGPWRAGKRQVLDGLVLGCGLVLLVGTLYLVTGACRIAVHPDTLRVWRTLLGFLPAAGLIAILEESIFRGFVLQQLLVCSRLVAAAGSSAAYALVHLKPNLMWPHSAFELTGLFILGWVLTISVFRTNQLYVAIGLHASLAYWARVNKLLIEFPDLSLQWLVGTSRLVNGVAVWVALLVLGGVIAWRKRAQPSG